MVKSNYLQQWATPMSEGQKEKCRINLVLHIFYTLLERGNFFPNASCFPGPLVAFSVVYWCKRVLSVFVQALQQPPPCSCQRRWQLCQSLSSEWRLTAMPSSFPISLDTFSRLMGWTYIRAQAGKRGQTVGSRWKNRLLNHYIVTISLEKHIISFKSLW